MDVSGSCQPGERSPAARVPPWPGWPAGTGPWPPERALRHPIPPADKASARCAASPLTTNLESVRAAPEGPPYEEDVVHPAMQEALIAQRVKDLHANAARARRAREARRGRRRWSA